MSLAVIMRLLFLIAALQSCAIIAVKENWSSVDLDWVRQASEVDDDVMQQRFADLTTAAKIAASRVRRRGPLTGKVVDGFKLPQKKCVHHFCFFKSRRRP